jgi:hypothetical protein
MTADADLFAALGIDEERPERRTGGHIVRMERIGEHRSRPRARDGARSAPALALRSTARRTDPRTRLDEIEQRIRDSDRRLRENGLL